MMQRNNFTPLLLGIAPVALLLLFAVSIRYGAKPIAASTVWDALLHFDAGNADHQIIRHSRLPRALGSFMIGAFLAVSGALMQGMTRNYLASPSIMGVTDGSAFAITLGMIFLPGASSLEMILYSLVGSLFGVLLVFGAAALLPGGMSPVRMAILGTIIGTFMSSASAAFAAYFQVSQNVSFWYSSRLHQLEPALIQLALPFAVIGLGIALLVSRQITVLSLGDEVSQGLGMRGWLVKAAAMGAVVLLTGISVALAGKIAFVGLIVPHIARFFVGVDYRRIIPCAGWLGGLFLMLCDILARFLNYPFELPVGVVTSLFGVPVFLYLIRKKGGGKHA